MLASRPSTPGGRTALIWLSRIFLARDRAGGTVVRPGPQSAATVLPGWRGDRGFPRPRCGGGRPRGLGRVGDDRVRRAAGWAQLAARRPHAGRCHRGAARMVPRCWARRGVRHRPRPAGQAARRRPAAARALPPGPGLQPGQPGLLARQDGSLDRAHGQRRRRLCLPGLPRRHPGRPAGRLGGQPGRARAGRRAAPGTGRRRGQRAGAGRYPACHRPRCVPGRTAGTDRPVHPAGVAWFPGRRHRSRQPRPRLPSCARGRGPHRVEPGPAGRDVPAGRITRHRRRPHPAAPGRR